ncbi:MAG: ankyrin repeat domain-containing protein [Flavobacterium sp.]|uniref:ankyrin repeat domain-containing protein n=1 Tax=Flavobacterium sp. TaxID=239 RepID=UPI0032649947
MKKQIKFLFLIIGMINFTFAQTKSVFDISRNGTLEDIKSLYDNNPNDINSFDQNKNSTLVLACYKGNEEVAFFLIDHVKDLNYNSGIGSALMAAVMSGKIEIVKKLIEAKANLNLFDTQGKTALIYATFFNKNEIAKVLMNAGANTRIKDIDSRVALDYANFNKNTELIILLNKQTN